MRELASVQDKAHPIQLQQQRAHTQTRNGQFFGFEAAEIVRHGVNGLHIAGDPWTCHLGVECEHLSSKFD